MLGFDPSSSSSSSSSSSLQQAGTTWFDFEYIPTNLASFQQVRGDGGRGLSDGGYPGGTGTWGAWAGGSRG